MDNYYQINRNLIISDFEPTKEAVVGYLLKQSTSEEADKIGCEAAMNFEKLLVELPYVGGDAHPGTRFIVEAGKWIAVYKALSKIGYCAKSVGQMLYSIFEAQLKQIPSDTLKQQGEQVYSDEYIKLLRQWADTTSPYYCDWKLDFIEGNGHAFDYGLDYRECPCLDLFRAQGANQLAPFFCLLDFPEAKLTNSGLFRTKTLAQGDEVCNFRFKKGKKVQQNWDTEIERILRTQ